MYTNINMDDWIRMNFANIFIEEIKNMIQAEEESTS